LIIFDFENLWNKKNKPSNIIKYKNLEKIKISFNKTYKTNKNFYIYQNKFYYKIKENLKVNIIKWNNNKPTNFLLINNFYKYDYNKKNVFKENLIIQEVFLKKYEDNKENIKIIDNFYLIIMKIFKKLKRKY